MTISCPSAEVLLIPVSSLSRKLIIRWVRASLFKDLAMHRVVVANRKNGISSDQRILNSHHFHPCWHAVAHCSAALPCRPPSGRIEKNGGMRGEEHLVFSHGGRNCRRRGDFFASSRARYNPILVKIGLEKSTHCKLVCGVSCLPCLKIVSPIWQMEWFYNGCTKQIISDIAVSRVMWALH